MINIYHAIHMLWKEFYFYLWLFFQQRRTDWAIYQRALYETLEWNYFEFGPVVQEKMPFRESSYLTLRQPSYLAEQNQLGNFGRRHYEEHFCENHFAFGPVIQEEIFSRALMGILFGGTKPFRQFGQRALGLWRTFLWNYFEFGPVVKEMALQTLNLMYMFHKKVTDIKIFAEPAFLTTIVTTKCSKSDVSQARIQEFSSGG